MSERSRPWDYLTPDDVIALHEQVINRWGGAHGLRDPGLLEAALYRPQTGYYATLIDEAAAMWESLSQNHAFLDGNKRIAFAAVYAFLRINGCRTTVDNDCAETFIADLYERNDLRFETLRDWLKANTEEASF